MSVLYVESGQTAYFRAQCDDARCGAYFDSATRSAAKDWDLNHWKEFHGYAVADES